MAFCPFVTGEQFNLGFLQTLWVSSKLQYVCTCTKTTRAL